MLCDEDAAISDPAEALNDLEYELIPAIGPQRTGLLMDVLRGVADGLPRTKTRELLNKYLEV